jgi:peptidoglycan/LPS O-acetylase OafA/YrhL
MHAPNADAPLARRSSAILDGWRGIAAQTVCVGHGLGYLAEGKWPRLSLLPDIAVMVFFCLSGFVITYSCIVKSARGGYGLPEYLLDRFSRIFIVFVPAVLFAFVAAPAIGNYDLAKGLAKPAIDLFASLAMLLPQPFNAIAIPVPFTDIYAPGWTVMVEWWIYVVFGLLFLAKRTGVVWALSLLFAGFVPAMYLVHPNFSGMTAMWIGGAVAFFAFSMLRQQPLSPGRLEVFIALLLALLVWRFRLVGTPGAGLIFALTFSALLAFGLARSEKHPRAQEIGPTLKLLQFSGRYAYSLYMVHFTVLQILLRHPDLLDALGGKRSWTLMAVYTIAANLVAVAFYFAFERRTPEFRRWLAGKLVGVRAFDSGLLRR